MVTQANQWKKNKGHELTVPSGNVCLVRRPGPEAFLTMSGSPDQGGVPNPLLQHIMPLLEDAQKKGGKGDSSPVPVEALDELRSVILENPEKLQDMFALMDNVVMNCVIAPVVSPASLRAEILADEELTSDQKTAKLEDCLFVDDVDFEDKAYIFNYVVGGTANLEQFREGALALVGSGQDGAEVPDQA